ncbi:hypothetical protein LTR84_011577 [Exophiala bonariae]|uniref:Poly(A) RNA polymerase mitochondrial-like central palm domain-containing protein n=1 Tax=Exophiala bonariae TaxID=1690606 RepID=A0AAV9NGE2_9EURO|nr:hypothetical protein LTR84_011577 [Exophiala bonariae]
MPSDYLFTRTRAILPCRHGCLNLFTSASTCRVDSQSRLSSTKPPSVAIDPLVDVHSLENTVEAHREANRSPGLYHRYEFSPQRGLIKSREGPQGGSNDPAAAARYEASRSLRRSLKSAQIGRGRIAGLTTQWMLTSDSKTPITQRVPWTKEVYQKALPDLVWLSAEERLSQEIEAFDAYVCPTIDEQSAAELAANDLRRIIKNADAEMDMDIIGSRATGTADPLSDIDANVSLPVTPSSMKTRIRPEQILPTIMKTIRVWRRHHPDEECPIQTLTHVKQAVVPILLCRHRKTGLPIQIQSTPRTFDSTEYVRSFLTEFPTLRGLFKVIRQVLHMRGLQHGQHGGLTSYPLLNMIVASLKLSEGKSAPLNSGAHLLQFLKLYSEIDFADVGISTRPLGLFSRNEDTPTEVQKAAEASGMYVPELMGQKHMIVRLRRSGAKVPLLQDPANPMNNLGKSAVKIRDVQETFIDLHHRLHLAMQEWDTTQAQASKNTSIPRSSTASYRHHSVLKILLEGDYRIYDYDRADIRRAVRDMNHTTTSKI